MTSTPGNCEFWRICIGHAAYTDGSETNPVSLFRAERSPGTQRDLLCAGNPNHICHGITAEIGLPLFPHVG